MYKCDICRKNYKSREKMHKVAILFRDRTYINYDKKGNEKLSKGKEIVKVVNMCENCFKRSVNNYGIRQNIYNRSNYKTIKRS